MGTSCSAEAAEHPGVTHVTVPSQAVGAAGSLPLEEAEASQPALGGREKNGLARTSGKERFEPVVIGVQRRTL